MNPPAEERMNQSAVRRRLATARVGIIGLGGLGSNVAMMLARSGVRRFVLADFDSVDEPNLNRQMYFPDQIGHLKVDALSEHLTRLVPDVELELHACRITRDNLPGIFGAIDVLIEAVDTAEDKTAIVETATDALPDVPVIWAMGLAGYSSANEIETRQLGETCWVIGDLEADVRDGLPLLAPRVMVAAAHEAHMAVRILLGHKEP
ncbi:MAG: thiamine biosynthesis protein ThiF [Actinobacteria bacterium HGW-Actinobacteria-10]|nr:MAG: thiamine biosynthesis protein ThiF [Actinobacteria bacterium HGW-Actinobacteria-10]